MYVIWYDNFIFSVLCNLVFLYKLLLYSDVFKHEFWMFLIADCKRNTSRCCKCVLFLTVKVVLYSKREHVILKILLILRLIQPFLQCIDVLFNFNYNLYLIAIQYFKIVNHFLSFFFFTYSYDHVMKGW